jgi:C1A family cysteine protease
MASNQQGDEPAQLIEENAALRQKLERYKSLEEDLAAQRVFEKAQRQLKNWITVGGIATLMAGIVGYNVITDYSESLVKDRMKAVAQSHIEEVLFQEGKRQIGDVVNKQLAELLAFIEQQKTQIRIAASPTALTGSKGTAPPNGVALPASVDYTDKMQPVRDQGQETAAVGFAIAAAVEYQIRKALGEIVAISPRYIYYYAREKEGTVSSDSGALMRDGVSVVATRGAVPESAWPYRPGEFAKAPPASVASARPYKISKYQALGNLNAIKSALARSGPVVIGVTMYEGFEEQATAKTGRIQMPRVNEKVLGGFAVCLIGYDDGQRLFKFRNSWSASWGDKGYGSLVSGKVLYRVG